MNGLEFGVRSLDISFVDYIFSVLSLENGAFPMQTRVSLWGGSCAVRLPKMAVETLGLHEGEPVTLSLEGDALVIRPSRKAYRLSELVSEAAGLDAPAPTDDGGFGSEVL